MSHNTPELPPPQQVLRPTTLLELQNTVRTSANVRAFAARHSGELWQAAQYIDMNAFTNILRLDSETITVEAGCQLTKVLATLAPQQRTLATVPSVLAASVGGTVLVAAHGSGTTTLSSEIIDLTFVLADGSLRTITASEPDFRYVVTSVGLLGILYSCTIRTVPAYKLYQRRLYTNLPPQWLTWLMSGLNRQFFYNPYRGKVLLYDHSYTADYGTDRGSLVGSLIDNPRGEKLAVTAYTKTPILLPDFIDLSYRALAGVSSGSSTKVLSIYEYKVAILDFELAVPVAEAEQALSQIKELVGKWRREHGYYLWFGVLLRYLKKDIGVLSQSGRGDVVTFAFPLYPSEQSKAFVVALQGVLGTNFHIGKYSPLPVTAHAHWNEFAGAKVRYDANSKFLR